MMKNILVVGGAGYIGSHVCKELFDKGYNPIAYDNLILGHRWSVNWGPLEVGDINDESRLLEVINKYKPYAVMHFAAFSNVGESVIDPNKYYLNNVAGTINLLNVMFRTNIKKMVFSSSAAISPIRESIVWSIPRTSNVSSFNGGTGSFSMQNDPRKYEI